MQYNCNYIAYKKQFVLAGLVFSMERLLIYWLSYCIIDL
ncbi:hypothetical protein J2X77_002550 [Sphingobacterium sp. 2149]|nr:hypothetical protein [Sphingobacterium sp. 2149]